MSASAGRTRALLGGLALAGAAAIAACAGPGVEFPARAQGRPSFLVNVVALPEGSDSVRVRISWEVPYSQLTFRQEDKWYRAPYEMTAVLSSGGGQVAGDVWDRSVRVASFAETRSGRLAKGRHELDVPVGNYKARITLTDRVSRSTSTVEAGLHAQFGATRIGLSEIRFLRYTGKGPEANAGRDIPVGQKGNVARVVLHPELAEAGSYEIRWRVTAGGHRTAASGDTTVSLGDDPVAVDLPIHSEELEVGAHGIEVRLEGAGGGTQETRKTTFFVRLTPQWFILHREEAQDVFDIIAPHDEAEELDHAPDSEWAAKVEAYWARHDPDPSTPRNEYREDIEQRMEAAATLFDEPFRHPGWRTDRGQVFLKYGRPARRTVRPADFEGPASELWEYESPRRLFFFVDERGTGEFWLRA